METINRRNLANGKIFHIINRGVDKRKIFLDDQDYLRFIHDLFEFNDISPAINSGRLIDSKNQSSKRKPRKLLVELLEFCLMPNHFHLLLKQGQEGGITKFLRKLSIGYANYFNQKYARSGTLFQGRFKSILTNRDEYFIYLSYYIHFNPLDLIMPAWRKGKIENYQKAVEFLKNYRWSSYLDYTDIKNFPSVTQRDFLLKFFQGHENYKKTTEDRLREMSSNLTRLGEMILE